MAYHNLYLTDSRNRLATGRRSIWRVATVEDAWRLVVNAECAIDERPHYFGCAPDDTEGFNEIWSCYGWELADYDDRFTPPKDCDLMAPTAPALECLDDA
jgi:hypothetical protein